MAYCTTADVVRELPLLTISASTKPSTGEVDQFCVDIDADMNARLHAVGIVTPLTDPLALAVLKPIAVNGVAAKVLRAKRTESGDTELAAVHEQLYQDAMHRIEERPTIVRDTDSPGQPQGTQRADVDVPFGRTAETW